MTTKTIIINAAQMEVAKRLGISPEIYAKSMAVTFEEPKPDLDESNPNNVEVYNLPIRVLRDLWLTKFGMAWVHEENIEGDDTWEIIAYRLREYGFIEDDTTCEWRKLKEEV